MVIMYDECQNSYDDLYEEDKCWHFFSVLQNTIDKVDFL